MTVSGAAAPPVPVGRVQLGGSMARQLTVQPHFLQFTTEAAGSPERRGSGGLRALDKVGNSLCYEKLSLGLPLMLTLSCARSLRSRRGGAELELS